MRKNSFYTFVLVFSPMVPSLELAGRSVYLFDLFFPFIALLFLAGVVRLKSNTIQFVFLVACICLLVLTLQTIIWGTVHSSSIVRFSAIALLIPMLKDFFCFNDFKIYMTKFLAIISVLGIFQFFDGYLFGNLFGINSLLSTLYPYAGDLSESALMKSDGSQLKSGSFSRATSIADGHPIIFGDLVASLSILLLFWKRYLVYRLSAFAVILTFSRGSWLMLVVGFLVFFLIEFRHLGFRLYLSVFFFLCIASFFVINIEAIHDAFYFRLMNTFYTFGFSDVAVGRSDDPRTAIIWPNFFSAMNAVGWKSYLSGYNIGLPTDSGHFAILRESGVVGYIVFLLFSIYSIFLSRFDKRIVSMLLVIFIGMVFHPVHQGYKIVFLTAISIAYCIVASRKKLDII